MRLLTRNTATLLLSLILTGWLFGCSGRSKEAVTPTPDYTGLTWQEIPLIDVTTEEHFTLGQFTGQVTIIDLMAVWCPNCLLQQHQLQLASANWREEDVIIISLDVEPKETATILRRHLQENNIAWRAAIAPQPLIDRLVAEFGPIATTVTATPLIFIGPDGNSQIVGRGLKPRRVLLQAVKELQ